MIHRRFLQQLIPATAFPLYVNFMDPQDNALEHKHDIMELVVVLRGHGEQYGGIYRETVSAGDVFLIPCGVSHGYRNGTPDFALINILFMPNALPIPQLDLSLLPGFQIFYSAKENAPVRYPGIHVEGEEFKQISGLAMELYTEYQQKKTGYFSCCIGIFTQLLCHILRNYSKTDSSGEKNSIPLSAVFSYLNTHYKEEVTLTELCRISHMSKSSLMRNFTKAAGCSPIQFLIRVRISEAMHLLCLSSLSISEIAWQTGFQDSNYFCRQFRKITGKTPLLFRKEQKQTKTEQNGNFML